MTTTEIQNTERVTKIFEAFGRGDVAYILDQLADDARFVSHLCRHHIAYSQTARLNAVDRRR